MRSGSVGFNRRLPAKERKDQTQHDADDDAGNDWEIESAVSSLDPNVAGQTSQPARTDASPKQNAKNDDHEANNDEQSSELRHRSISVSDLVVSSGVALDWERHCPSGSDLPSRRCIGPT